MNEVGSENPPALCLMTIILKERGNGSLKMVTEQNAIHVLVPFKSTKMLLDLTVYFIEPVKHLCPTDL